MGVVFLEHLGGICTIHCRKCQTFLTNCENCYERDFIGQKGRAYLFHKVVNITFGKLQDKWMNTGRYKVRDAFCKKCGYGLGWRYEHAFDSAETWKEGNTILWSHLMSTRRRRHIKPPSPPPKAPPCPCLEVTYEDLDPVFH